MTARKASPFACTKEGDAEASTIRLIATRETMLVRRGDE